MISNRTTFYIGILGASIFVLSSVLGGFLIENYSISSQYISETYAVDTQYGIYLRAFGYIPSGILLTLFAIAAYKKFPKSRSTKLGFYGLAIFYGIATIIVGFFPCDSGCNKEFIDPSLSQVIHNIIGFFTYLLVPISIISIGIGLKKSSEHNKLSTQGIAYGVISILLVYLFLSNPKSEYTGLYQRLVEAVFIIWIISCAQTIKKL